MKTAKIFQHFQKVSFVFLRSFQLFFDFVIIYLLFTYIGGSIIVNKNYQEIASNTDIFLISNGVHLDICVPFDINWQEFLPKDEGSNIYQYISFGWGDKNFFLHTPTWADLKLSVALYGTLLPSPTAMHVTYYRGKPRRSNWVRAIKISAKQYATLCEEIKSSFKLGDNVRPILIDCCRYPGAKNDFYEGRGSYYFINTCNEWVNTSFKKAGLKAALWAPFDRTLLEFYE